MADLIPRPTTHLLRHGAAACLLLLIAGTPSPARAQDAEHLFVFILDGIRADHGFDDPTHEFVGPLYHELAPQGSLLTYMEVRAQTVTLPAHQALVSGNYADYSGTTPYPERRRMGPRTPTLCEAYRVHSGADMDSCWIISNSDYLHDTVYGLMPGYGEDYSGSRSIFYEADPTDEWSWDELDVALAAGTIDLAVINLNETDLEGHREDWDAYTGAAAMASEDIVAFWERLQADPEYQDNTVLIVTSDHGRHLEGVETGWQGHGDECAGCRQVFMLALGPGVRQGFVSDMSCSFIDVAPTAAALMGFPFPYSRGRVLTEILEDGDEVDPGPGGAFRPTLARSGDVLVRMSEQQDTALADDEGAHRVLTEVSEDGGATWTETLTEAGGEIQHSPFAWTDGEVILAGWLEIASKGEAWVVRLRRLGPESQDWMEVAYLDMIAASTPVSNVHLEQQGELLYMVENNSRNRRVRIWSSDDLGLSWSDEFVMQQHERHFPRDLSHVEIDGTWVVVYAAHPNNDMNESDPNENTEIYWLRSDDAGVTWEGEAALTDDWSPSIQPVTALTPDGIIHVVFSDARSGEFQLYHSESTDDGASFSPPEQLTFGSIGAWEPAVAADGERLYVTWSQFEGRDDATVHVAALEDGSLVEERTLSAAGLVARTPHILPMGDCTSLVTWSEGDLSGAWQLAEARVDSAGIPATSATATLIDGEIVTGFAAGEVVLGIELTLEDGDRGVNRIEITGSEGVEFTGDAELYVFGDAADATATVDGQTLIVESDVNIDAEDAQIEVRFDVVPPAEPGAVGTLTVVLKQGLEACVTEVAADLELLAVEGTPDDDDTPGDDDDDTDGCECRADDAAAPGAVGALLALSGLVMVRRRRQSRDG